MVHPTSPTFWFRRPAFPDFWFRQPAFPAFWFGQPAFPTLWFGHFVLLSFPGKRNGLDRQKSSLSLTPRVRGGFRWSSVFKILEPISLPPTDMLRPREKSMKARRKMGALSRYPTAAVAVLSIIGCGLWWANLSPFQPTDDAVIGDGVLTAKCQRDGQLSAWPPKWLLVAVRLPHWSWS